MARIDEVRERYESITEQLYKNRDTFAEYLKFAGKFFKMPTAQTIAMFASNPKATMVADYDTWRKFGRQVMRGTNSIAVLDGSGLKHYFDISQTSGGKPPYQWTLDKRTAQEFIAAFSKAESKEYKSMSGCVNAIGRTATANNLENAIKALNIPEADRAAFEKSFVSITQYFIAARCELGGKFDYKNNPMDLAAFDLVHSKAEAEKLTEYVQLTARPALLSMEKTINSLIAERSIDNGRSKTDLVQRGQEVLSRNQGGERQDVQAGSGNVRVSGAGGAGADGRGTAAPERTDRPLGKGVAEIHDGELSGGDSVAGGSPEMGADSPSDRQGSMGDVGISAEAVRREESSPENDIHRNRALGENTEFHSGTRGNGADSSSAQRINNTAAEDIFPAVSVFIGLAAGALYENDLVRNAHRNTDRENFDVEVESAVTSYYTRLITGRESSEYSAEQLAPLYNRFQRDNDFRVEVISEVADRLDESLTSLEVARSKAAELGIPFSDRPYDSEKDDPYAYDGSMSIADSRKVADASNLHDFMLDYSDELEMAAASYNADEFRSYFAERAAEAVRNSHNEALTEMRENSEYLKSVADLVSDGLYNDIRSEIQQRNIKYPCVYVNGSHNRNFSPEEVGFLVNYPYSVEEFNAALNRANEIWNNDEKYLDSLHSVSVSVYASRTESSSYDVELYASYHSIGKIIDEKQSIASANILGKIKAAISEIENKPQDEIPDDVDKFYVNSEMENVTWIRYDLDSTAGGQFVCTYMSFDDIFDAMEQTDPLEYLTEHCGQELLDRGAEGFDGVAEEFMTDSEDISSHESDCLSKLFALTEPRYAIYQLKDDEKLRDYHFTNSEHLKNHGMYIDRENYDHAPVYSGITNWTMGASLSADEFEDLTTRFHNGEDVSAELAKRIYANMRYLNFEYPPADGISRVEISSEKTDTGMTFRTKGGFEVSHTWEVLGNALITASKQEFDRHEQLDREYFLKEAKARINEYSQREFREDANFSDISHVPLAYTTHEDTEVGISVYADLENKKIVTMYGDKVAEEKNFRFSDDMISALGNLEFSDLVSIPDETVQRLTEPQNDILSNSSTEGVQLNLFGESAENYAPRKQTAITTADTNSPLITQDMFDCVLRCGSNEPRSLERIINQYQLNKGAERNAEFLRNEFGTNARGIDFGQSTGAADRRITAWYDENGITIGLGDTAFNSPAQKTITWEQAAERIEELLGDGNFANQVTIDDAEAYTRRKLAEKLWYLSRDVEGDFFIPDEFFAGGFPESTERISEALKGEKPVSEFIAGMTDLIKRCEADKDVLRFPHRNLHEILENLKDLQLERREFRTEKNFEFSPVMFISEEEKDLLILSGSGVQGGKFRIENYFNQPHSSKEKADFLKNEYGTGGSGRTGYDTWHDAKGIVLNKGGFGGSEATVKMKWNEVAARIDRLISQKKYITQRDINNRIRSAQWTVDNSDDPQQIESAKKILAKYSANSPKPVKEPTPAARPVQVEAPVEKHDFTITDEHLGEGGQKAKFSANIAVIRTLKAIEGENRLATPEEQTVLSKYVGWGGLSQAFDENNSSWANEHKELAETLTEDEYTAAKSTVLNAHYTSPTVINGIYKGLAALGFSGGNVLEPAMGVGNFFGVMPEEIRKESRLHGVELDSITGRIAKQLYQTADIQIRGYEETTFSDNYFDAAIGNVPFGNYGVFDKRYNKENFLIHDYFFAKTLDKVAPNGIVAFVTTKGTLDKQNPKVREYLAKRADLVGAVRLPNNAFKANAGTEVTADIIFLQKREKMAVEMPDWCYVGKNDEGVPVNSYFLDHPEMILGTMKQGMEFSLYGNASETACVPIEGANLKEQLERAVGNLKLNNVLRKHNEQRDKQAGIIPATADVRNFTFAEVDGKMYFRENNIMTEVTETGKRLDRIKVLNELRTTFREILSAQENNCSDEQLAELQARLNRQYDSFVKQYGYVNDSANGQVFDKDDDYNSLCALEIVDEEKKTIEKSDFFTKRTVKYTAEISHVDTPQEAMQVSIDTRGKMDIPYMAQLCGQEPQAVIDVLKADNLIYLNPLKTSEDNPIEGWEETSEYLSGNVREKLRTAELYARDNPDFQRNVSALTEVIPPKLEAGDITARIGVSWVDVEDYQHFLEDYAKARFYEPMRRTVTGEYKIENKNWDTSAAATQIYGTARMPAKTIFENLLNNRDIVVKDKITDVDGKEHYEINKKQTDLAQDKALKMKDAFKRWLWEKPERREKYVERYNNLFNCIVGRQFDGSHQTFPGMSPSIRLKPHQLDAVMRAKFGGNTLLAHCVGAGKSFEMLAATMEKKRLGLINKACVVVPKHLVGQMANEWLRLYPQAKILTASEKDFDKDHRQKFIGRCCTGDYDAVIMSYEQFEKIPMSMEYRKNFIQHEIDAMQNGIDELNGDYRTRANNRSSIKDLEREKKRLEARLQKLIEGSGKAKDTSLTFEQLGFDSLVVDEAHNYKNGLVVSKMNRVSGVQTTPAQKSEDILMKTQYLNENYGEKNIIFATGTPVFTPYQRSNTEFNINACFVGNRHNFNHR